MYILSLSQIAYGTFYVQAFKTLKFTFFWFFCALAMNCVAIKLEWNSEEFQKLLFQHLQKLRGVGRAQHINIGEDLNFYDLSIQFNYSFFWSGMYKLLIHAFFHTLFLLTVKLLIFLVHFCLFVLFFLHTALKERMIIVTIS